MNTKKICTIIQMGVFCVDKTCFLRPGHIYKKIVQQRAAKLWAFLCLTAFKITEKDRKFTFQAIVKKANHLARFDD